MSFTSTLIMLFMNHHHCTSLLDCLGQSNYRSLFLLVILYLLQRRCLSTKFLKNMAKNMSDRHTKKPTSKMKRMKNQLNQFMVTTTSINLILNNCCNRLGSFLSKIKVIKQNQIALKDREFVHNYLVEILILLKNTQSRELV